MAYTNTELSQMAYTGANGGNSLFFYANSAQDTVTATGFFNDVADVLNVGDIILDVDGGIFYRVSAISDGAVTVAAVHDAPA